MRNIDSPFMRALAEIEREGRRVRRLEWWLGVVTLAAVGGWVLLLCLSFSR